jgi:hypothetical protein
LDEKDAEDRQTAYMQQLNVGTTTIPQLKNALPSLVSLPVPYFAGAVSSESAISVMATSSISQNEMSFVCFALLVLLVLSCLLSLLYLSIFRFKHPGTKSVLALKEYKSQTLRQLLSPSNSSEYNNVTRFQNFMCISCQRRFTIH